MEDPVGPIERNLYGHPLAGLLWERQFEKNPIAARLGEGSLLGMLIRAPKKKQDENYLCMCMTSNWLQRNKILIRCAKYSIKKFIWENQHHSLIMCTWDGLKDNVK